MYTDLPVTRRQCELADAATLWAAEREAAAA